MRFMSEPPTTTHPASIAAFHSTLSQSTKMGSGRFCVYSSRRHTTENQAQGAVLGVVAGMDASNRAELSDSQRRKGSTESKRFSFSL